MEIDLTGDSIRDLFIPDRWRSLNHLWVRVTFSPSKNGHQELPGALQALLSGSIVWEDQLSTYI